MSTNVVSIERFARAVAGQHAEQVEAYSLGRFMEGLHDDDESETSEKDRGAGGESDHE